MLKHKDLPTLTDDMMAEAMERRLQWVEKARPDQLPPEGTWETWMLLGGRGAGKTRTGAEETIWRAVRNPGIRIAVVAPTESDIRDTCFEGDSGLLSVLPPSWYYPGCYTRSLTELTLPNGSLIKGFSSVKPARLRGPQFGFAWLDEFFAWENLEETLDMLNFGLRLGTHPQKIVTSTPKPVPIARTWDKMSREPNAKVIISRSSSYDNKDNLAKGFFDQIAQYEGTRLGRQEIHAEILDPEEGGIVKRSWLGMWSAKLALPRFDFIALSLDTAFTERTFDKKERKADPTACTVWGVFHNPLTKRRDVMLMDAWQDQLGIDDLLARGKEEMKKRYGEFNVPIVQPMFGSKYSYATSSGKTADVAIIEDKGAGISMRQHLSRLGFPVWKYNPGRSSKLERLHLVSHYFHEKRVWIPESKKRPGQFVTWADDFIGQLCSYSGPGTTYHDDYIDTATQALRCIADRGMLRIADAEKEREQASIRAASVVNLARARNPYDC